MACCQVRPLVECMPRGCSVRHLKLTETLFLSLSFSWHHLLVLWLYTFEHEQTKEHPETMFADDNLRITGGHTREEAIHAAHTDINSTPK